MPSPPVVPPPKRPPPKSPNIPPVTETTGHRSYPVDPYSALTKNLPVKPPARPATASEHDYEVVRHGEQIRSLDRRLEAVEEVVPSILDKLDTINDKVTTEINDRKLEKATKEQEKVQEDQKTKRLQAILIAIPLILSPILGIVTSYLSRETPNKQEITKVIVSEYTEAAQKCLKENETIPSYEQCIRKAQLENTPLFRK